MEAIIDTANAEGVRSTPSWPRTTARRSASRGAPGQGLRPDPPERPGRRHGEPAERGCWLAVRRRLEEHQRARQGRRCGRAPALRGQGDRRHRHPGRTHRRARRRPPRARRSRPSRPRAATCVTSFIGQVTPVTADTLDIPGRGRLEIVRQRTLRAVTDPASGRRSARMPRGVGGTRGVAAPSVRGTRLSARGSRSTKSRRERQRSSSASDLRPGQSGAQVARVTRTREDDILSRAADTRHASRTSSGRGSAVLGAPRSNPRLLRHARRARS